MRGREPTKIFTGRFGITGLRCCFCAASSNTSREANRFAASFIVPSIVPHAPFARSLLPDLPAKVWTTARALQGGLGPAIGLPAAAGNSAADSKHRLLVDVLLCARPDIRTRSAWTHMRNWRRLLTAFARWGFLLHWKWLTTVQMVCIATGREFRFLRRHISARNEAGSGRAYPGRDRPWNGRCRSGNLLVECGLGPGDLASVPLGSRDSQ